MKSCHAVRFQIPFFLLLFCTLGAGAQDLYWDPPSVIQDRNVRYPQAVAGSSFMAVVWQEYVPKGDEEGDIYLSLAAGDGEGGFEKHLRFAGPFPFTGKESSIFSLAMLPDDTIAVAVASSDRTLKVLLSRTRGRTFDSSATLSSGETLVAPRLFPKKGGGLLLFATRNIEDSLGISFAVSPDGVSWSNFRQLVADPSLKPNFLPHYLFFQGTEYVVFQNLFSGNEKTYQIYLTKSTDEGTSWSTPVRISDFPETVAGKAVPAEQFDNQRPQLSVSGGRLFLTWERNTGRVPKQVYVAELAADGGFRHEPEKATEGLGTCNFPQLVDNGGSPLLVWFDNRRGEDNIFIARKNGVFWEDTRLSTAGGSSLYPRPVVFKGRLYMFWENRTGSVSRLLFLAPDRTVAPPRPKPVNFTTERPRAMSTVRFSWDLPEDSSGIAGYSWLWDRTPDSTPARELTVLRTERLAELRADADGPWYFHISTLDYAGNWSSAAHLGFIRDLSPPGPVSWTGPDADETGAVPSNSFVVRWDAPPETDVVGYSHALQYLSWDPYAGIDEVRPALKPPPARLMGNVREQSFRNLDNGLWAFSVQAFDASGNIGAPTVRFLRLTSYVPVTYISDVRPEVDLLGDAVLSISGRGFSEGGNVSSVIVDLDAREPWDYVFESSAFRVLNDRAIGALKFSRPKGGTYRVGVVHPSRGTYFTRPLLTVENPRSIKFGDFSHEYTPSWKIVTKRLPFARGEEIAVWGIVASLALCITWLSVRLAGIVGEGYVYRSEMRALLSGTDEAVPIYKERVSRMRRKGIGLRAKFAFFIMVLVAAIVLMSAIPLGYYMIDSQGKMLAQSLEKKTAVLLESLAQGARTYLPQKSTLELGLLLQQTAAMEEARFATITGEAVGSGSFDALWATNDAEIPGKVAGGIPEVGKSVLSDSISGRIQEIAHGINTAADEQVSVMVKDLESLNAEALRYALNVDEESQKKVSELQTVIQALDSRVNMALNRIAYVIGSEPEFRSDSLSRGTNLYTFYKPIVYRVRGQNTYYRGLVRLGVSTENIMSEIDQSRDSIIRITAIIALISVVIGMLGSLLLASITVIPIKRLVRGVEIIRDTDDKANLKNHIIEVRTRDELSELADTVNEMTQGLVKAAIANRDLTVGKEVQKMFIPLERDSSGKKLTTGKEITEKAEFFGYYEGAKGVSGDYFDFTRLDNRYYAIIKCDVAGKGVPAALIMVEVATIFISHFKDWEKNKKNLDLTVLVYRINDLLEERGFKGRFAALTVALFDAKTGECSICNAGDTLIHVYEQKSRKMVLRELPKSPAAGVFPSMLVEMKSPFTQYRLPLSPGDTVFFFTDGLEEAKRNFRDSSLRQVACTEPGLREGELHGTHPFGSGDEEFGIERIHEIVAAVHDGSRFSLSKHHNHIPEEKLEFDFSGCSGTAEESILALVAVEKVFRIFPDPSAGKDQKVQVDRKIDEFLKKHFLQYASYFSHPVAAAEASEYLYFSHIREDEQYDDLTILGVRMKTP